MPGDAPSRPLGSRLLVPSAALLWGLHSSLLSPALALILATLYDASTADIGWSLAIYNTGGFIASLVLPAWADRHRTYLRMLMGAAVLTIALAAALAAASTLPWATVALVVLGGPAGLGTTMLFAHLRDAGAATSTIVDTRAIISAAWMGGPPLATAIIGWAGPRGVLLALVVIALVNIATTAVMMRGRRRDADDCSRAYPSRAPRGAEDRRESRASGLAAERRRMGRSDGDRIRHSHRRAAVEQPRAKGGPDGRRSDRATSVPR